MAIYNIHAGHNFYVPGAGGCFSETEQTRVVKNKVIALLRAESHTVYDCTDEEGRTANQNLANIVSLQNSHRVDLDVSIHFNAFNGAAHGVEVLQYSSKTQSVAQNIADRIAELGFFNRGVKDGSRLYVLKRSNCPAILIECCFCDSQTDANIYNADRMAEAIVKGILFKSSIASAPSSSSNVNVSNTNLYRIRKSWDDVKSQIGAYKILDDAKNECPDGYSVYDWNGNSVYSKNTVVQEELYRVRKSWDDAKSQIGAYKILDNAKNECSQGYYVFDWNGNIVYTPTVETEDNVTDDKNIEDTEIKPVNNLASMSQDEFIQYIGNIAKSDENKILPSITIAQAILESAWGKSELSSRANNLFGMKKSLSGDNWGSQWGGKIYTKTTNEEVNGELIQVYADFRAYDSVEESVKDHNKYLACAKNGSSLRYDGIVGEKDYTKVANLLVSGGYATDSKYADKLCELIEHYNLDSFDYASNSDELESLKNENNDLKKENTEMKSFLGTILETLENIIKGIKNILKK